MQANGAGTIEARLPRRGGVGGAPPPALIWCVGPNAMARNRRRFAVRIALVLCRLAGRLMRYADADVAEQHIRISTELAGWGNSAADELIARGLAPAVVDRLFADALGRLQ